MRMGTGIPARPRICIIDDDRDIRDIYITKFTLEGFDVVAAKDGEEGLGAIRRERPDIILLDLNMPVKDGLEVLRELDRNTELSGIPVIVLSNVDDEDVFREVGKFDTRFYLIKALNDPQKVVDHVREAL